MYKNSFMCIYIYIYINVSFLLPYCLSTLYSCSVRRFHRSYKEENLSFLFTRVLCICGRAGDSVSDERES